MVLLFPLLVGTVWASCVNYQALGYYGDGKVYIAGLPPANAKTYVTLPNGMTPCDLEELELFCIDRINGYRNGTLKFTGTNPVPDPGVPKPKLNHYSNNDRCANAMALGDLWSNGGAGGCVAGHKNAFACPGSNSGQNSCCYRSGTTVTTIKNQLTNCLQQMWDEGIGLADNAAFTSANGHWYNMRATNNIWASCSFAFTSDGGLWMNQDFFSAGSNTCSCPGAGGVSDNCAGTCYGTGAAACASAYTQGGYAVTGCGTNTASGTNCAATCAAQFAGTVGGTVSCSNGAYTGSFSGCVSYCPADAGWPATAPGTAATPMACPPGQAGSITRMCGATGTWQSQVVNCQIPQNCTDRIQNQDETCIDCGGTKCPACQPCDCVTCGSHGNCTNGNCTCLDGWTGPQCNTPPDPCSTVTCLNGGSCNGGVCTCINNYTGATCATPPPASCSDGIKNQDETAIDCGGVCPACPSYQWVASPWSNCSVSCGGGVQTRNVECADLNGTIVAPGNCSSLHPLDLSQLCNIDPCPSFTWVTGAWSTCSAPCNTGFQTRSVQCQSSVGPTIVANSFCTANSQPLSQQNCNTDVCMGYHWSSSAWTPCTVTCGGGTQTRTVSCLDINNTVSTDASLCDALLTPPTQQSCNLLLCDSYKWQACPTFLPCTAQCNGGGSMVGIQYRDVFCLRQSDKAVVDASLCTDPSPTTALSVCNTQACTNYNWMADANWGPCERDASGLYSRNRTFHCHTASGQAALVSDCQMHAGTKPIARMPCSPGVCSDANGCPSVQIGSFFNFCKEIPDSCQPYSSCLTSSKELDDAFASLGTPAATAAQCVQSFNDGLSPVDRFPQTLIDATKARLSAGLTACDGALLSSASALSVGVTTLAIISFVM